MNLMLAASFLAFFSVAWGLDTTPSSPSLRAWNQDVPRFLQGSPDLCECEPDDTDLVCTVRDPHINKETRKLGCCGPYLERIFDRKHNTLPPPKVVTCKGVEIEVTFLELKDNEIVGFMFEVLTIGERGISHIGGKNGRGTTVWKPCDGGSFCGSSLQLTTDKGLSHLDFCVSELDDCAPSAAPSSEPSDAPSAMPSASPSATPSASPSASPTQSPTASPTESPTTSPSASPSASPTQSPTDGCDLVCPNCFGPNDACDNCEPVEDDTCDPCVTVTLDNGDTVTGNQFCETFGELPNEYKCCPPTSSCKKTVIGGRTDSGPSARSVSLVCSTNCGDCDAAKSGNARACTLFDTLELGCDGLAQSDDTFETCATEATAVITDSC